MTAPIRPRTTESILNNLKDRVRVLEALPGNQSSLFRFWWGTPGALDAGEVISNATDTQLTLSSTTGCQTGDGCVIEFNDATDEMRLMPNGGAAMFLFFDLLWGTGFAGFKRMWMECTPSAGASPFTLPVVGALSNNQSGYKPFVETSWDVSYMSMWIPIAPIVLPPDYLSLTFHVRQESGGDQTLSQAQITPFYPYDANANIVGLTT